LPAAIAAVSPNGEIWMLDSANYNQDGVNVPKSVTITALPGQVGSIMAVAGKPAITMGASVVLNLRNISIATNVNNPGTYGISMTSGMLSVEDSVFQVLNNAAETSAIDVNGEGIVSIHRSLFRHSYNGITAQGGAKIDVTDTKFFDIINSAVYVLGVAGTATTKANVERCAISYSYTPLWARSVTTGGIARLTVSSSSITYSYYGVMSTSTAPSDVVVTVQGSNISHNQYYGFWQTGPGSVLESLGNNLVRDNDQGVSYGTITSVGGV